MIHFSTPLKKIARFICLALLFLTGLRDLKLHAQVLSLPDSSFGLNGRVAIQHGFSVSGSSGNGVRALKLYADGRILLAATSKPFGNQSNREYFAGRLMPDGTPDSTFNDSARVFISGEPNAGALHSAEIGPGNKIVLAGNRQNPFTLINESFLVKLKADGTRDSSFGTNGLLAFSGSLIGSISEAVDARILANEKILVTAQVRLTSGNPGLEFCLIRLNPDGSLDSEFGDNGKTFIVDPATPDRPYRMAVQSDGKVLLAGITTIEGVPAFKVARIREDGKIDSLFGQNGTVIIDRGTERTPNLNDLVIQDDSKILLAGNWSVNSSDSRLTIVRLKPDGSRDEEFGTEGIVNIIPLSIAEKILINTDKSILAVGRNFDQVVIARLLGNGEPDQNFGVMGAAELGNANPSSTDLTAALLPDGKVLIGGRWTNNGLNHYSVLKVKFIQKGSAGLTELTDPAVQIYPNPAGDCFFLSDPYNRFNLCRVFDASGRAIMSASLNTGAPVDVSAIGSGIYIIELSGSNTVGRTKLIKK